METFNYVPSAVGLMSIPDSARLLRAVFPNYPTLDVIAPAPALVQLAPAPDAEIMARLIALGVLAESPAPAPARHSSSPRENRARLRLAFEPCARRKVGAPLSS